MGTPHNEAEKGEIAKRVLMPGDPLRAKYIAEHFLKDAVCFNTVRNMLGYTGTYKGEKISVMGGGMGVPSVGIYTYELYHEYEVEEIIRIGSAGALQDDVDLRDVVIDCRIIIIKYIGSKYISGTDCQTFLSYRVYGTFQ